MKQQDSLQTRQVSGGGKQPYQPPKAVAVPVKAEERFVQGCRFNNWRVCGPNR